MDAALKNARELSDRDYLESSHDGSIYDIAFDGNTLLFASEAWVGTHPMEPLRGQNFNVIYSRYCATFSGASNLSVELIHEDDFDEEEFEGLTVADLMDMEIRGFIFGASDVTIETDCLRLTFQFEGLKVERFPPGF